MPNAASGEIRQWVIIRSVVIAATLVLLFIYFSPTLFGFPADIDSHAANFVMRPNEWGDLFAGVFGSLSFMALLYGLFLQSRELRATQVELRAQTTQMEQQAKAFASQVELMGLQMRTSEENLRFAKTQSKLVILSQLNRSVQECRTVIKAMAEFIEGSASFGRWSFATSLTEGYFGDHLQFLVELFEKDAADEDGIETKILPFGGDHYETSTRIEAFFLADGSRGTDLFKRLTWALAEIEQIKQLDAEIAEIIPPDVDDMNFIRDVLSKHERVHIYKTE